MTSSVIIEEAVEFAIAQVKKHGHGEVRVVIQNGQVHLIEKMERILVPKK